MAKGFRKDTKIERRYKTKIFENSKNERLYPPGQHGVLGYRGKLSSYAKQLATKQLLRYHFNIGESQFETLFIKASKKSGDTGNNFVNLLERRLDAFLYRSKMAKSIHASKQLISHKHVKVNDKVVNIASYTLQLNDVVKVRKRMRRNNIVLEAVLNKDRALPEYAELLGIGESEFESKLISHPSATNCLIPFNFDLNALIAFYSK